MPSADPTKQTKIFISHRHADNEIAMALRKGLINWGMPFKGKDGSTGAFFLLVRRGFVTFKTGSLINPHVV